MSSSSPPAPDDRTLPGVISPEHRRALATVLERARGWGFLGPGPIDNHVQRSLAFLPAWTSVCASTPAFTAASAPAFTAASAPDTVLDLGSGGGVPGLVLAVAWPTSHVLLLDGSQRRVAFLDEAIDALGLRGRVRAVAQRAEEAGRSTLRGRYAFVTARGFGPPAVTAECGAPLLRPDGILAVAEPPGGDSARWPAAPLAQLGLEVAGLVTDPASVQVLRRWGPLPDRYPRRVGIPAKRPLWP